MAILLVVDNPGNWELRIPGVELVGARAYLTEPRYTELRGITAYNLCRSYAYQSLGYYVSMLAEARGHRPQPSISTIQDMKMQALWRIASDDLAEGIQRALAPIRSREFTLSIYFGRSLAQRHRRLALHLFNQFQAPLLRARFVKRREGWQLEGIRPIPANDIPDSHRPFVVEAATAHFGGRRRWSKRRPPRYDLAILHDPLELTAPSCPSALTRFVRAAHRLGLDAELITKDDYGRLAEFDALFIRQTTAVNHHTYRFARRAAAEGLVVVDDPTSIVRCANKVYLAELFERHEIPVPRTLIVHRQNRDQVLDEIELPCVLKQPDSSFSRGVVKVHDAEALETELERLLKDSELVIAQEFVPTEFDWRVGIFDRKPLYACRYHMAHRHWQVLRHDARGRMTAGRVETIAIESAPRHVVRTAVRAAELIGDGLYGVDLKQRGRRCTVIEVNDNPNLEAGYEDRVLGNALYDRILAVFLARIERRKSRDAGPRAAP